ncbi:hypothetical protein FACS189481_5860 [Clostridia bacterium]|nr:hypothetical protein FACS189481_5860 [Clostridia bacterium]
MNTSTLTPALANYLSKLAHSEKSNSTITAYRKDIKQFIDFIGTRDSLDKPVMFEYKKHLQEISGSTATINRKIIAINKFLRFIDPETKLTIQTLKNQRVHSLDNIMSFSDYERCLKWALNLGKGKYYAIMKVLAGTGIRIGELKYIYG